MSSEAPPPQKAVDAQGSPHTLGDLLRGEAFRRPVAEAEWVQLVQAVAAGDQRALQVLYSRAHRIVFTLMLRMTSSAQTAEELTADVFHEVWRRASTYDAANGTVVGWIMNQARSRAIDRLRFDQRKKRVHTDEDGQLPSTAEAGPEETLQFKERRRLLQDALTVLSPEERAAIETAFFFDVTYHEAASRLNQPLGTVKSRIRSGLAKLRHALGETAGGS